MSERSTRRAEPFHCPFCAEEDLRPDESDANRADAWLCTGCRRVFTVSLLGLRHPEVTG